jgi:hypothetical protein
MTGIQNGAESRFPTGRAIVAIAHPALDVKFVANQSDRTGIWENRQELQPFPCPAAR